jgi:pimeloyl-ACP methyl ester carboxylesterase
MLSPAMAGVTTREFAFHGYRLVFDEFGAGPSPVVLLPGLLLPRSMHTPLAHELAEHGHRVFTLDFLAHGESDRPTDMAEYSMQSCAEQVIALLDHLELDEAVVGGTSLGANATLEVAAAAPDRLRGMVIEMPVLDNALLGCAIVFTPLLVALTFGAPVTRVFTKAAQLAPRGAWHWGDVLLDWVGQDPGPSAAMIQGLFFGRTAPPRAERTCMETKALVIGHSRDPVHPFSDSDALVRELPDARLVQANSIFELRFSPERLTGEIAEFVRECWRPRRARPRGGAARRTASA